MLINSAIAATAGTGFNPWLPAERYVPDAGGASNSTSSSVPTPAFPVRALAMYSKGNVAGIAKKIGQFTEQVRGLAGVQYSIQFLTMRLCTADWHRAWPQRR